MQSAGAGSVYNGLHLLGAAAVADLDVHLIAAPLGLLHSGDILHGIGPQRRFLLDLQHGLIHLLHGSLIVLKTV